MTLIDGRKDSKKRKRERKKIDISNNGKMRKIKMEEKCKNKNCFVLCRKINIDVICPQGRIKDSCLLFLLVTLAFLIFFI